MSLMLHKLNNIRSLRTLSREFSIDVLEEMLEKSPKVEFWYKNGEKNALADINIEIKKNNVTALIGPSGCGKSTFLRSLNRMNDLIDGVKTTGDI